MLIPAKNSSGNTNSISGVFEGSEPAFKDLVKLILEQRCRLISRIDLTMLDNVSANLESRYSAEKNKIAALKDLLVSIDSSSKSSSTSPRSQLIIDAREKYLLSELNRGTDLPSVKFDNLLDSINPSEFQIMKSSVESEKTALSVFCKTISEYLNDKYIVGALNKFENFGYGVYDPKENHDADIYLGLYSAMKALKCNQPGSIIAYIIKKTIEEIKASANTAQNAFVIHEPGKKPRVVSKVPKEIKDKIKTIESKQSEDDGTKVVPLFGACTNNDSEVDDKYKKEVPSRACK